MHALTYERRRLTGVRSTWLVPVVVLAASATVAALTLRQAAAAGSPAADPLRVLTAGLPLLPLPLAALGAGVVGALSAGHEFRHPAPLALLRPLRRRLALLVAKLVVVGAFGALLGAATLLLDAAVLHVADHGAAAALESAALHGHLPPALGGYLALVLAGGWIGLLGAVLLRSAAAGMLVLITVPVLIEPVASAVFGQAAGGNGGSALHWHRLFPVDGHHAWLYGAVSGLHSGTTVSDLGLAIAVVAPVAVLLLAYLVLLPRRSAL
ncbi:hypothetical protein [Streptacidiphilus jiangxiensis]|uniref:Uncharacterized protein n=1 Tax=Streptacidiphilus jiangxiensis TaxID=235985 RepID=A0A1H7KM42_STRJI|nr:hypothetical protein [Streptacidiphilus jiangxiensis]SEK87901.1 hypothetical protein SAMN05414137_104115 [Streptacidiphilus jiangxiensis]